MPSPQPAGHVRPQVHAQVDPRQADRRRQRDRARHQRRARQPQSARVDEGGRDPHGRVGGVPARERGARSSRRAGRSGAAGRCPPSSRGRSRRPTRSRPRARAAPRSARVWRAGCSVTTTTVAQVGNAPRSVTTLATSVSIARLQVGGQVEQLLVERRQARVARQDHHVERVHVHAHAPDRERRGQLEAEPARRDPVPEEAHLRSDHADQRARSGAGRPAARRRTAGRISGWRSWASSQSRISRRRR